MGDRGGYRARNPSRKQSRILTLIYRELPLLRSGCPLRSAQLLGEPLLLRGAGSESARRKLIHYLLRVRVSR